MIHEYALDPDVISDWQNFRYFVDSFGVSEGRLISQFPKHWKRLVYEAVGKKHPTAIERARIEERLRRIDDRLLKKSRHFIGEKDWISNAVETNNAQPFYAIITTQKQQGTNNLLIAEDVDKDNPLWNIKAQKSVPRTASDLAQAVRPLLEIAEEIIFIDPYFYPNEIRFRRPLEKFLQTALPNSSKIKRIEYHVKVKFENESQRITYGHNFDTACQDKLPSIIPDGFSVTFIRWKERQGGKDFHARYILTERGGVLIENGLDDDDDDGGKFTSVVLLSSEIHQQIWNDFQKLPDMMQCVYQYDNEITIDGNLKKGAE